MAPAGEFIRFAYGSLADSGPERVAYKGQVATDQGKFGRTARPRPGLSIFGLMEETYPFLKV